VSDGKTSRYWPIRWRIEEVGHEEVNACAIEYLSYRSGGGLNRLAVHQNLHGTAHLQPERPPRGNGKLGVHLITVIKNLGTSGDVDSCLFQQGLGNPCQGVHGNKLAINGDDRG
jgi:hypothetical protein